VREGVFEEKLSQREKTELMIIANPRKYCAEPRLGLKHKNFRRSRDVDNWRFAPAHLLQISTTGVSKTMRGA